MAFQPTEDGLRLVLEWNSAVQGTYTNHLWFRRPSFTPEEVDELLDAVEEAVPGADFTWVAGNAGLIRLRAVDERTEGAAQVIREIGRSGAAGGDGTSQNVALVLTLRTAMRGRAYRGRIYVGGLAETLVANGMVDEIPANAAVSFFQDIRNNALAAGWLMGVRSGYLNGVKRPSAVVTPVIAIQFRNRIVGSQRRRVRRG